MPRRSTSSSSAGVGSRAPTGGRDRRSGRPGRQRARNRWIGGCSTISSSSPSANSRCPRTAASAEVTASSDRPPRSPEKMMWTTCFAAKLRAGRDRVHDRDRALEREQVVDPDLLGELAAQRVDERLARVHPAAGQQPVLLPRLLVPAEQDAVAPAAGARRPGCAARRSSVPGRAEAARAALARRAARPPRAAPRRAPRRRRAGRSACRARPRTSRAGRCCAGSRAARRGSPSRRARARSRS